jgi:hypothetical protein
MTMAELIALHRGAGFFLERNALLMTSRPLRQASDRAPALAALLWERSGALPRNIIFVEATWSAPRK